MKSLLLLAALVAPASAAVVDRADPPPLLRVRFIGGFGGYTVDELASNLEITASNISQLNAYLNPFDKGARRPSGEHAAAARRSMDAESEAARALIAEGEIAIQRNIDRKPLDRMLERVADYVLSPIMMPASGDEAELRVYLAMARANHAGALGTLLSLKRRTAPQADREAFYERLAADTRRHLAEAESRISAAKAGASQR